MIFSGVILSVILLGVTFFGGVFYATQKSGVVKIVLKNDSANEVILGYKIKESFGPASHFEHMVKPNGQLVFNVGINSDADLTVFSRREGNTSEASEYVTRGYPVTILTPPTFIASFQNNIVSISKMAARH
ncbi:hypothetical protein [Phyllobacterium leguminum]|uniref:Uncharacterized protein n=1 Tax=Phyllobacterium leguminum TaxID=314237 RepID=A0A318SZE1_9HYPH|nr:hypothetical protein [Phyllobacterium leguminum]PYE85147.1 hypothetical protein C7477_1405 [Phyllobacterium leguminum]